MLVDLPSGLCLRFEAVQTGEKKILKATSQKRFKKVQNNLRLNKMPHQVWTGIYPYSCVFIGSTKSTIHEGQYCCVIWEQTPVHYRRNSYTDEVSLKIGLRNQRVKRQSQRINR